MTLRYVKCCLYSKVTKSEITLKLLKGQTVISSVHTMLLPGNSKSLSAELFKKKWSNEICFTHKSAVYSYLRWAGEVSPMLWLMRRY